MFVVLCMLVASIPQAIFASDYENHWAKEAIAKWSEQEIVVGYEDGTFRPSKAITRGEHLFQSGQVLRFLHFHQKVF